jgi:hypothetical protein
MDSSTQLSSGSSQICVTSASADVFGITGLQCATVVTATSALSGSGLDQVQLVRSWAPSDMETATYITGDTLSDVFARTLLLNVTEDRWPGSGSINLDDWKACGGNGLFGPAARSATAEMCDPFDRTKYWSSTAYYCCYGRSFVTTAEGYIGLGPPGVESGLSALPFVLCCVHCP